MCESQDFDGNDHFFAQPQLSAMPKSEISQVQTICDLFL
jgi:hypothetical protein